MSNYVLIYYGEPKFESREAGAEYRQKWESWVSGVGDAWVNPGTPIMMPRTTVSKAGISDSSGTTTLTGFAIVKAGSIDDAVAIARACPHIEHGTIDVAEAYEM